MKRIGKDDVFRCIPSTPAEAADLIGQNRDVIARMVRNLLKTHKKLQSQDVEDLISECWMNVFKKVPQWYDPTRAIQLQTVIHRNVQRTVSSFLYRSALRADRNRQLEAQYHRDNVVTRQPSTPPEDFEFNLLEARLLEDCVPNGTPIQQILYHRYVEKKDWREVEAATGINYETARNKAQQWYDHVVLGL